MLETTCDEQKNQHIKRRKYGQRPREMKECTEQKEQRGSKKKQMRENEI